MDERGKASSNVLDSAVFILKIRITTLDSFEQVEKSQGWWQEQPCAVPLAVTAAGAHPCRPLRLCLRPSVSIRFNLQVVSLLNHLKVRRTLRTSGGVPESEDVVSHSHGTVTLTRTLRVDTMPLSSSQPTSRSGHSNVVARFPHPRIRTRSETKRAFSCHIALVLSNPDRFPSPSSPCLVSTVIKQAGHSFFLRDQQEVGQETPYDCVNAAPHGPFTTNSGFSYRCIYRLMFNCKKNLSFLSASRSPCSP